MWLDRMINGHTVDQIIVGGELGSEFFLVPWRVVNQTHIQMMQCIYALSSS
jgi:hypothetical protein